jgi:hypothetical protein
MENRRGLPYPDFRLAALDTTTCAAFIKESRMKFADATELRHLGQSLELWAVLRFVAQRPAQVLGDPGGVAGLRHYQHTPVRRVTDQMSDRDEAPV